MTACIRIDLNVRVRGNQTYAGLEDVAGQIEIGDAVSVLEPESGLRGVGLITDIDHLNRLVYVAVEWASMREDMQRSLTIVVAGQSVMSVASRQVAVATRRSSGLQQQLEAAAAVTSPA